jgi:hypothetical protein
VKRITGTVIASLIVAVWCSCFGALTVRAITAQDTAPKAAPSLTQEQKLTLQTIAQRIEIAQLKAQQAQSDFDRARQDLAASLKALQVEGYTLDLNTLSYTKKPDAKKPDESTVKK